MARQSSSVTICLSSAEGVPDARAVGIDASAPDSDVGDEGLTQSAHLIRVGRAPASADAMRDCQIDAASAMSFIVVRT